VNRMWSRYLPGFSAGVLAFAAVMATGTARAQMTQPGGMGQPGTSSPTNQNAPMSEQNNMAMSGMNQAGGASMQDKDFLHTAAEGGLFEVMAGQLASQNAANPQVKQFGAWMVKQHTQLNNSMKPFLQRADVPVPTQLKGKEKDEYEKLQGLHGAAFDAVYVPMMVKDHKKDLSAFEMEASSTHMPGLRPAVMHGEQVITAHLNRIKQIASQTPQPS
jgi:putative membrane protein